MTIFDFMPGYKTYIVGIGMIATAIGPGLMAGDFGQIDWPLAMEGLGFMTVRKAIARVQGE